jgi:hypothetical protein
LARIDFAPPGTTGNANPLKGNLSWLQIGTGAGAGTTAIPVANWAGNNLVTAQQFPWFLEPSFATPTTPWVIDPAAIGAFETAIAAVSTFNEWAANPATGAATDWVLTFPTKLYHVDKFNEQIQAAVSKYRNGMLAVVSTDGLTTDPAALQATDCNADRTLCQDNGVPLALAPFEHLFGVQGTGDSTITVEYNLFDREEGTVVFESDGTSISPAPPPDVVIESLRWEANVVQFSNASVLGSPNPAVVDASGALNGANNGWANLVFTAADPAVGLPVTAFAVKARDQGEPSSAYGQAMDNGYTPPTP